MTCSDSNSFQKRSIENCERESTMLKYFIVDLLLTISALNYFLLESEIFNYLLTAWSHAADFFRNRYFFRCSSFGKFAFENGNFLTTSTTTMNFLMTVADTTHGKGS